MNQSTIDMKHITFKTLLTSSIDISDSNWPNGKLYWQTSSLTTVEFAESSLYYDTVETSVTSACFVSRLPQIKGILSPN
jgi:hypothetical protein